MTLHARLTLLLLCGSLNGCLLFDPLIDLPRDVAVLSDHARAESALRRGDLPAAEGFLTGKRFTHRSREVVGSSWGQLTYRAVQVVLAAHARGEEVEPEALYQAYMSMSDSHDLPFALEQLQHAQQLVDSGKLATPESKRNQIFNHRFPTLVLYRYLESGGQLDWNSNAGMGLPWLRFPAQEPKPGEHDPRDFYRFPAYLTLEDREWLFSRLRLREPLDEAIWRDEARLSAFTRSEAYYDWYDENGFDWLLISAVNRLQGPEQVCIAHKRGYDVIGSHGWDIHGEVDPQTCRLRR